MTFSRIKGIIIYNGHGDVTALIDENGEVANRYDYDVWGNFTQKEETVANPFTYFGQTYDETIGLFYLRARYYDPTTGRFTQQDPAKDGYNWYVYGNNNPIYFSDPSGLTIRALTEIAAERGLSVNWNGLSGSERAVSVKGYTFTLNKQYMNGDYSLKLNGYEQSADLLSLHSGNSKIYIDDSLFDCYIDDGSGIVDESWMIDAACLSVATGLKGGTTIAKLIGNAAPVLGQISQQTQQHIMQEKHMWHKVVSDPNNWSQINGVINE